MRPIRIGDRVITSGYEGVITRLDLDRGEIWFRLNTEEVNVLFTALDWNEERGVWIVLNPEDIA